MYVFVLHPRRRVQGGGGRGGDREPPHEVVEPIDPDHATAGWRCVLCASICLSISGMRRHAKVHGYSFKVAGGHQRWRRLPSPKRCEVLAKIRVNQGRAKDRRRLFETHFGCRPPSSGSRYQVSKSRFSHSSVCRRMSPTASTSRFADGQREDGARSGNWARLRRRLRTPEGDQSPKPSCSPKRRKVRSPRLVLTPVDAGSNSSRLPQRRESSTGPAETDDAAHVSLESPSSSPARPLWVRSLSAVPAKTLVEKGQSSMSCVMRDSVEASTAISIGSREQMPSLTPSSGTLSMVSELDVSFSEDVGLSTLIELVSCSPIEDSAPMSQRSQPDWFDFSRKFLSHSGENQHQYQRPLDTVFGAGSPSEGSRCMVLEACSALLYEVCMRFPEVYREVGREFPSGMPEPDETDVLISI